MAPSKIAKTPPPKPAEEPSKAATHAQHAGQESEHRLKRLMEIIEGNREIPAFSNHIMEVMGMMGSDEASLRTLTNIILRDYSLTLAVLRLANSAYYNRSGKSVCSVTRAVTLMGIEAVKRLTGGMLLLENYEKRPAGLKELLLLSMLTASHCYEAAQQLNIQDAEQVYMCGMFRNMGEVLVALYFNETYEKILLEMKDNNLTAHEASLKVMDITYESLGRAIASSWKLPASVSRVMSPPNPGNFSKQDDEEKLKTLVAFSHDLTQCVYRCPPEERSQALDGLLERYSSIPNLDRKTIQKVLDEAVTKTKDTFATVGVPLNDLHLRRQYEQALAGKKEPQPPGGATLAAVTDLGEAAAAPPAALPHGPDENLLAQLVAEVQSAMEPGTEPKLHEVLMMAMEACHRGAGFDRVVFCLAMRDRSSVRGRIGLGPSIEKVIEILQIPLYGHTEPLTLPLITKRDLFIDAQLDDRYHDSNLVTRLGASCFGLFPVVVENVVVGCLYFDKLTPNSLPSQTILDTLAGLRNLLAELIHRTRAHA
jgi:HD-like signal output (HDOD) protein